MVYPKPCRASMWARDRGGVAKYPWAVHVLGLPL